MQDMNQEFGLSTQDDTTRSRNLAAIALAEAMSRARTQQTGRESAKIDLRAGAIARLEALRKKLAPLYSAIPHDVDLFDLGLISHEKPRLFVDIIAFIELNRDQTGYRFLQETRAGRIILAETDDEKHLITVVTDYVASRLIERERALSADDMFASTNAPKAVASSFSSSSHAHSAVSTPLPEADLTQDAVQAVSNEGLIKRGNEPAITAAEAFRQWSHSSVSTQASVEPVSQVEQLVNAHKAAALAVRRLPHGQTVHLESAQEHAQNLQTHALQATNLQGTIHPAFTPQVKAAIDPLVVHTHAERGAADADLATAAQSAAVVAPAPVERAGTALHSAVVAEQSAALNIASNVQTGAAKTVAGLATAAGAVAAATPLANRKINSAWTPGWWIWPLLALLLGIGLGAFMLYVYAANLVR